MALFNKKKNSYFSEATIITKGTTTIGNFIGDDSIHIDGSIKGDVKVNNVVIISKSGAVNGKIKAQQVISSGIINGNIICDSLELLETSTSKSHIKANKVLTKGSIVGDIVCSGLFISENASVKSNIQAKDITVAGELEGKLTCKELRIMSTSRVKGSMYADRIINQGGQVEGFIGQYSDAIINNPHLTCYGSILNSQKDIALLEQLDYHVNVEEEIQNKINPSKNQNREDDFYIDVELATKEESESCKIV